VERLALNSIYVLGMTWDDESDETLRWRLPNNYNMAENKFFVKKYFQLFV